MNLKILLHTLSHLRFTQIVYQVKYRLIKPHYVDKTVDGFNSVSFYTEWIEKSKCYTPDGFRFLNLQTKTEDWNYTENGMLWAYNLNYMDWLCQEGMEFEEGAKWIDKFIDERISNRIGLDPYPIALRGINWIKFICKFSKQIDAEQLKRWNNILFSQYCLLEKKLEYHLLGNHLLEDAFSLFIASVYFRDNRLYKKASKLLLEQLKEQILPDGAHYEQSPMYHCIMLDRLLDCINLVKGLELRVKSSYKVDELKQFAVRMLGHLESIVWADGSIPLLNDAAYGIAPTPAQLFDYAKRLGLEWEVIPLKECGYRKLRNERMEAVVDVGDITASYQPGHTHADVLNYELRIDGKPFIVDTGISTYNKTDRRQYERSTAAHNCVVVDGRDSSEVWGGFRVGRRSSTKLKIENGELRIIKAEHNGYDKPCIRTFKMTDEAFIIEDEYAGEAVSYIHLAKDADMSRIDVEGAKRIEIIDGQYSQEYNKFKECKVMAITFVNNLKYTIL